MNAELENIRSALEGNINAEECANHSAKKERRIADAREALSLFDALFDGKVLVPVERINKAHEWASDIEDKICRQELTTSQVFTRMRDLLYPKVAASQEPRSAALPQVLPPFAKNILNRLRRVEAHFRDGQDADIGSHWLDVLVLLGLLNRVQRSPAKWEITQQGEDFLAASQEQK